MDKVVKMIISGRVQRVGFRKWIAKKILSLDENAFGYVKNLENRDVELVIKNSEEIIDEVVKFAYKGPLLARVDSVQIEILSNNDIKTLNLGKFSINLTKD